MNTLPKIFTEAYPIEAHRIVSGLKYEVWPLYYFYKQSKELGIKVSDITDNRKHRTPDFILDLEDGRSINLEVTTFTVQKLDKYNSFFRKVESIAEPIISKHLCLLPVGCYNFHIVPGPKAFAEDCGHDTPSFDTEISKEKIEPELEEKILAWFSDYKISKKDFCEYCNQDGKRVGIIRMSMTAGVDETTFMIFPQTTRLLKSLDMCDVQKQLQDIIEKKELKYKKDRQLPQYDKQKWWILIADANRILIDYRIKRNIGSVKLSSVHFDRIFIMCGDHVIEVPYKL